MSIHIDLCIHTHTYLYIYISTCIWFYMCVYSMCIYRERESERETEIPFHSKVFARFGTRMSAPVTADEQLCSALAFWDRSPIQSDDDDEDQSSDDRSDDTDDAISMRKVMVARSDDGPAIGGVVADAAVMIAAREATSWRLSPPSSPLPAPCLPRLRW